MSSPVATGAQLRKRSTRRKLVLAAALVVLLLLAVLLPPWINIGRYRRSIAGIVSRSLGRPVHIGSVQLRLLPVPGIEMTDFEVDEDPAFGAEPALRASTVVATLRLSSLWRGRLEVSRIGLEDASLNLVRNARGRWSIGSVLDQAAHLSNAPTAQPRAGSSPRFPYIEATDARINFKEGLEKKPFSLMNAEFSMWLDTPDAWRVRLKAQPARTDLDPNLSDAGELTVEGSMRRAADIGAMPVNLEAEWRGAQLGQVSRLLMASDTGWRGDLDITAALTGEVRHLHLKSRIRIDNAHRLEFEPAIPANIDARCEGDSLPAAHAIENLTCFLPAGAGHLLLTGNLHGLGQSNLFGSSLKLAINHAPAALAVDLVALMRQRAANATATGAISGEFEYTAATQTGAETFTGQATVDQATLLCPGLDQPLKLPPLHFTASPAVPISLALQTVPISLGADTPLNVSGSFSRFGFSLHFSGQAALARLLPLSRNFGLMQPSLALAAPQPLTANASQPAVGAPQSTLVLDLSVQAPWLVPVADQDHPEFATVTSGSAQLRNIQIHAGFLSEPLDIASGAIDFAPSGTAWNNVSAVFHRIPLHGSVSWPAACASPSPCPVEFSLDTNTVDAAALQSAIMGAGDHGELLDAILARMGGQHHPWPALHGSVRIAALQLGELPLRNVAASVAIAGTSVHIASLDAGALGGTLHAKGDMDAQSSEPVWKLDVQFARISAAETSALFHQRWGAGTIGAETQLTMHGFRAETLASSAAGTFHFDWQNGIQPPALIPAGFTLAGPPHFDRWIGEGTIVASALTLTHSQLFHGKQTLPVSGTIPFHQVTTPSAGTPHQP